MPTWYLAAGIVTEGKSGVVSIPRWRGRAEFSTPLPHTCIKPSAAFEASLRVLPAVTMPLSTPSRKRAKPNCPSWKV